MEHISQIPAPLLVKQLPLLRKGKVLDVASGYGRNAFFLASNGFQVDGYDQDKAAVTFCNEKSRKEHLPFSAFCVDLETEIPFTDESYDLATCFYYLDRKLIPSIKKSLRIGGITIYETFLIDQHQQFGKPSRTDFCWKHNELIKNFSDFRIHFYNEGMIYPDTTNSDQKSDEGRWVVQLIAERVA